MGHVQRRDKARTPGEVRQWFGNLLVAWTVITGLAATLASAYWYRYRDLKIVIAYLGAPFLIGCALFLTLGIMALASRVQPPRRDVIEPPQGVRHRDLMFGRR